jgi:hypothetical protein
MAYMNIMGRFQHLACDHCYGQVKRDDECAAEPIKGPRSPTGSCNYHGIPGPWDPQAGTQNQITSIARWHFSISSPHFFLAVSCVESAPLSYTDCSKIRLNRGYSSIGEGSATEDALLVARHLWLSRGCQNAT